MTENEERSQRQSELSDELDGQQARNMISSFVGGGVAHHITEECERLFCGRLRATFLGERKVAASQDPLVMGALERDQISKSLAGHSVIQYLEMYDYRGDAKFRGFVAQTAGGERVMFVFFEPDVVAKDLKPGLMALLELAYEKGFDCSEMVVCLDRDMSEQDTTNISRDLGWVGFELTTLEPWNRTVEDTSERWLLLAMET